MKPVPDRAPQVDRLAQAVLDWFNANAAQGIFTTDAALRIRSWNQWLVAATGLQQEAVIGRPLLEVLPSFVDRGMDRYYTDALSGQVKVLSHSLHRFIVPTPGAGGRREQMPQSGRVAPLSEGGQIIGTITMVDDVSERVKSERELRAQIVTADKARFTAENASRVKDEFLATLSHEIRTPLNAVLGWTRILLGREHPDMPTVRRAIEVIDRNASAQLTLISDMLDMARIATGKVRLDMKDVDLAAVALAAIDVVHPTADAKNVRLVVAVGPGLPAVSGDADRLLQIVWNLLSNAVKFTDSGGQVTLGVNRHEDAVQVTVADTGQGITPEFLPDVFKRFKQADPSSSRRHGGLGLGLALVRELVELHGGTVYVESEGVGQGSTFVVSLPARGVAAAPPIARRRETDSTPVALAGVRILVVEDDADALEILCRTLADAGATITAARSVHEALALLRGDSLDPPHAVVSDIGMPGDDGYGFLRALRTLPPGHGDVPVIAVTAYATPEDRKRALQAGFDAHFGKPFSPKRLVEAIARAVAM